MVCIAQISFQLNDFWLIGKNPKKKLIVTYLEQCFNSSYLGNTANDPMPKINGLHLALNNALMSFHCFSKPSSWLLLMVIFILSVGYWPCIFKNVFFQTHLCK
jgi:hypothetical protein